MIYDLKWNEIPEKFEMIWKDFKLEFGNLIPIGLETVFKDFGKVILFGNVLKMVLKENRSTKLTLVVGK